MKKRDLEETPAYKRAARQNDFKQKMMAARMTDIEDRFRDDLKAERTGEIEPGTANFNRTRAYSELDSDPRYKMDPLPGEEAPATATPAPAAAQQPQSTTEQPAVSLAPPQVGEVRKGYIYLGGDPKLPTSWRRQ
jgi:hypothetical protein